MQKRIQKKKSNSKLQKQCRLPPNENLTKYEKPSLQWKYSTTVNNTDDNDSIESQNMQPLRIYYETKVYFGKIPLTGKKNNGDHDFEMCSQHSSACITQTTQPDSEKIEELSETVLQKLKFN